MKDFTFYSPTKFVFGKDTEQRIGQLCREAGATKVLWSMAASPPKRAAYWTASNAR